ncbi:MAG: exo-alpha-sialidase [Acidobacteria bacterium]|nr:exo-alpha-sialidase [Acidobacteriota bacterium]MBI3262150.1 exo-alpha-sialidase [Acidobacteriota bacterium]
MTPTSRLGRGVFCFAMACSFAGLAAPTDSARALDWPIRVAPLLAPAAEPSAQPQLSVVAGHAILSWIERSGPRATLKFAERTTSGWSDPRVVASGDDWFVNWADVPSVTALADGTLAAHWLQKSANSTYAYDVRLSFSQNGGRTWSPSVTPHHDGTATEHGFASLFPAPGAGLGLVWLDGRAMKADGHEGHGNMSVRSAVFDPAGKQLSEALVDDRVCECCPTAVAVTSDGVIVAYRNRSAEEVRDIYVARFADGRWSEPSPVHADRWRINACPVNGPALSARDRDVVIAWFNALQDQGHVFAAFSRDGGRTFGTPIRIDEAGSLGRVDVELLADGSAAVAWIAFAEQRAQLQVRRVTPEGERSTPVTVAGIGATRASGYPRLARDGNDLLFGWTETENGSSRVRTAVAALDGSATQR